MVRAVQNWNNTWNRVFFCIVTYIVCKLGKKVGFSYNLLLFPSFFLTTFFHSDVSSYWFSELLRLSEKLAVGQFLWEPEQLRKSIGTQAGFQVKKKNLLTYVCHVAQILMEKSRKNAVQINRLSLGGALYPAELPCQGWEGTLSCNLFTGAPLSYFWLKQQEARAE